jgi:hypothetical protein
VLTWMPSEWHDPRMSRKHKGVCLLQFRAVSLELWGIEDYHRSIRRKAVQHMRFLPHHVLLSLQFTFTMCRSSFCSCNKIFRKALVLLQESL